MKMGGLGVVPRPTYTIKYSNGVIKKQHAKNMEREVLLVASPDNSVTKVDVSVDGTYNINPKSNDLFLKRSVTINDFRDMYFDDKKLRHVDKPKKINYVSGSDFCKYFTDIRMVNNTHGVIYKNKKLKSASTANKLTNALYGIPKSMKPENGTDIRNKII